MSEFFAAVHQTLIGLGALLSLAVGVALAGFACGMLSCLIPEKWINRILWAIGLLSLGFFVGGFFQ